MGMPAMGMGLTFICPKWPALPFMCTIPYAAGFACCANCCWAKELLLARPPDGQPFISED